MPVRARSEPCSISGSVIGSQSDTKCAVSTCNGSVFAETPITTNISKRLERTKHRRTRSLSQQANGCRKPQLSTFSPQVGCKMSTSENNILNVRMVDGLPNFCRRSSSDRPSRLSDFAAWQKRRSQRMSRMHSLDRDVPSFSAVSQACPGSVSLDRRDKLLKTRSLDDGQMSRSRLSSSLQFDILNAIYLSEVKMSQVGSLWIPSLLVIAPWTWIPGSLGCTLDTKVMCRCTLNIILLEYYDGYQDHWKFRVFV